jgi:hypothetical protein
LQISNRPLVGLLLRFAEMKVVIFLHTVVSWNENLSRDLFSEFALSVIKKAVGG